MNNGGKPAHNPLYTIQAGITTAFILVELGVILFRREIITDPLIKNLWYILAVIIAVMFAPAAARRLVKKPGFNGPSTAADKKHILRGYVVFSALFTYQIINRFQEHFVANTQWDTWHIPLAVAGALGVFLYWYFISKPEKEAHD